MFPFKRQRFLMKYLEPNPLEWEDMINQSKNFIEFLIEYYSEQFLEENNKDTYKFLEVLLPFIIESCDENQQSFLS